MSSLRSALVAALVFPLAAVAQSASMPDASPSLEAQQPARNHKNELHMGDLPGNAMTLRGGTLLLHPILPSGFGITDNLEIKTSLLGLFGGPNVVAEYSLMLGEGTALSIEPGLSTGWGFQTFTGAAQVRFTQRLGDNMYFNANAGGSYTQLPATDTTPAVGLISVPVSVGFDIQTSPHTIWDFRAGTDVMSFSGLLPYGTVGFAWYHSFGGSFQLGLGLDLFVGRMPDLLVQVAQLANISLPALAIIPVPDITFGWKF